MSSPSESLLHYLRRLTASAVNDASDAVLLELFTSQGDEAAFTALLLRHGPMVLSVCRRILRNCTDAEDAFQATFLALTRKAGSLRKPGALASWLYGTARHLASTVQRAELRRRQRETDCLESAAIASSGDLLDDLSARELLLALDEETARLPEAYRLPLILCHLEGRTHEEAARLLGWTAGSLRGRLERGRKQLQARLTRRGLGLGASLLALESMATATVSAALRQATVQRALAFASGSANDIAARILALAETGAATMTSAKAKVGLMLLLTMTLAAGTGTLVYSVRTEKQPEPKQAMEPQSSKPETETPAHTDRYGDPLPPGALMRLGTRRFRVPGLFSGVQIDLPDHPTKLVYRKDAVLWRDAETWKEIDRWNAPHGLKIDRISSDGKRAFLSGAETLQLWDLASRKRIQTFDYKNESEQVDGYFPPDGKALVTLHGVNYQPGLVRVWDVATRKELWQEGVVGIWKLGICPLGFQEGGRTLIVRHKEDNSISLRDLRTGRTQRSFSTMPVNNSRRISLSPDNRTLMMGTDGHSVRSWDIASGKENPPLGGHKGQAHSFAFSSDGKSVATGGEDSFVQVWDWPSGRLRRRIDFGSGSPESIGFTPDGQRLEIVIFGEKALRYWDIKSGRELPPLAEGHRGPVHGVYFLPNGEVISTGLDNTIRIWDPASGRMLRQFSTGLSYGASKLSRSVRGKTLAVGDSNLPDIQLLDATTGKKIRTLKTIYKCCICIAISPVGDLMASTSYQRQPNDQRTLVQLWDASTGREVRRFGDKFCGWLAFSPDGQFLAVNHKDHIGIWLAATGERHRSISVKDVSELCFSPDGRMLVTGNSKNGVTFWEMATIKDRLTLKHPNTESSPSTLCFSPDGRYLATAANSDKAIYLYDARTGKLIHRFTGHESSPEALAFSADGRVLASGSFDTTILLWDVAGVTAKRRAPAAPLSAKKIEACWDALAGEDAAAAYRAIGELTASPRETIAFLRDRIHGVEPVEEKAIAKLVLDLDSPVFATREQASEELSKLDLVAEPALRKALTAQPSPEVRRRVRQLLEQRASTPSRFQLRSLRAVELLEHVGTLEARQLLETLAGGAAGARLTQQAKASLTRLAVRPAVKP